MNSCWRIFSFRLHQEEPNVVRLQVHLPDEQLITYDENDSPEEVLAAAEARTTTLLQWFELNKRDPNACQYLYQETPAHYTWNKRKWNLCQKYTTIGVTIGRMYQAAPSSGERFYLRLLLTAVTGAQSFNTYALSTMWSVLLLKKHALLWDCWKMIMNGDNAYRRQLLCSQEHSCDHYL